MVTFNSPDQHKIIKLYWFHKLASD